MATMIVLAKAPVPGRVKTRLCPPCDPAQAAEIAAASLLDTFDAVEKLDVERRLLVLDGDPALVPGRSPFEVIPQAQGSLGARLDAAFRVVDGPAVLIAMDTPQVATAQLTQAFAELATSDAVYGPAADGGFWLVGFRSYVHGAFDGVPMSEPTTGAAQLSRLRALGRSVAMLDEVFDIDTAADLDRLLIEHPRLRTSRAWDRISTRPR